MDGGGVTQVFRSAELGGKTCWHLSCKQNIAISNGELSRKWFTMEEIARALNAKLKTKKVAKKRKTPIVPTDPAAAAEAFEAEKRKKRRERERKKKQKKRKKAKAETATSVEKSSKTSGEAGSSRVDKAKPTVTIALPGSIVDNCQSRELQSYVAGVFHSLTITCISPRSLDDPLSFCAL